jgi:hypothetical protein
LKSAYLAYNARTALVSISKGEFHMTLGPIDFIALEFPGNRFRGEILPELMAGW